MRASVAIVACVSAASAVAQTPGWALPNFSDRIELIAANPTGRAMDAVVVLDDAAVRRLASQFPGTLAIVADDRTPVAYLPSQADALDGADQPGQFAFEVHLAPHEKKPLSIYYSSTLRESLPETPRVYAAHSYGYNRATAAIESELIGYRTYGGFLLDVQAHARDQHGLFNSLIGFSRTSMPSALGQDVFHIGDTLGLGGLFLRSGDAVYRPPFNTPDYTHREPKADEPSYRVLANGPLRAVIESDLPNWTIGGDVISVRARYEMRAEEELVRCRWWIAPVHVTRTYVTGAGIRDLPSGHESQTVSMLLASGTQDAHIGVIALGIGFSPRQAKLAGTLATPEARNQTIIFREELTGAHTASGSYTAAAAWQGSGWPDPAVHVRDVLSHTEEPIITLVAHQTNPQPQALESEPQ